MSAIRDFLDQTVRLMRNNARGSAGELCYYGPMDAVLRHGRAWAPYSERQFPRGEPGQCFANAQRLVINNAELTYVEGYAMSVIPLHHAWCVDAEGRVMDVTWDRREGAEYFGAPISTHYLRALWLRTGHSTAVFDNWVDDPPQPILTGHHDVALWLLPWRRSGEPLAP